MKIKLVRPQGVLPRRATQGSAGYDLSACIDEPFTLLPGALARIPTGIAIQIPSGDLVGLVVIRSSLGAKHGIVLANSVGVIDSDYRGELQVTLHNSGEQSYTIEPGERLAQLLLVPVVTPLLVEVQELEETDRGTGGFGSTGKYADQKKKTE